MKRIVLLLALAACGSSKSTPPPVTADATHIPITVTNAGFQPSPITVQKGVATTLIFTRTSDDTCAKQVVIPVGDTKITKDLPLNQPVEVAVTFPTAGEVQYACGMDMVHAVVSVK